MRLTKDEFINGVNKVKQMHDEETLIINAIDVAPEWVCGKWLWSYYELLNAMCDLPVNNIIGTDLDWYCWETQFGKHNNEITIDIDDGDDCKVYAINTPEDLWDFWEKETDYLWE